MTTITGCHHHYYSGLDGAKRPFIHCQQHNWEQHMKLFHLNNTPTWRDVRHHCFEYVKAEPMFPEAPIRIGPSHPQKLTFNECKGDKADNVPHHHAMRTFNWRQAFASNSNRPLSRVILDNFHTFFKGFICISLPRCLFSHLVMR